MARGKDDHPNLHRPLPDRMHEDGQGLQLLDVIRHQVDDAADTLGGDIAAVEPEGFAVHHVHELNLRVSRTTWQPTQRLMMLSCTRHRAITTLRGYCHSLQNAQHGEPPVLIGNLRVLSCVHLITNSIRAASSDNCCDALPEITTS